MQTEKDAELYRGVNTASPPQHPMLVPGWIAPEPPAGYRNLVAILCPVKVDSRSTTAWFLDYLNTESAAFASEEQEVEVAWPWVDGFKPLADDWDSIGIPHLA
ncbi:hypothetical protein EGJ86_22280 [Pseudomonas sp. o96-267]|uniref:hypothetical protein n=1 Tax=Pseudomonas sp. o96-267 TaxID=2479853 RepID=UPI000F7961A0|nr:MULTISPECIES: hypothetical protein [Pseudomonas]MDH0960902.1 hypothetical protein [Pseudomonas chengduensis]MDV5863680.1 hypothetical protein [Pseudomonas mendocina]RRV29969.1 hypothetical protein EGJ86_22280 [Pseudomonas sp. o96-267]